MNKWIDKKTFMSMIQEGSSLMIGGFLTCGTPEVFIDWLVESNVKHLTIIANDAGYPEQGIGKLIKNNQVDKIIATHIGTNPEAGKRMSEGSLRVELVPQGTLVEQIRAQGAGLGGVLTPTGLHTPAQDGKRIIEVDGKPYILAEPIQADFALILANQSDELGNLTYLSSSRNFNPMMATAAKVTIAYAMNPVLAIDPEHVITPHIFVDYLVGGKNHGS